MSRLEILSIQAGYADVTILDAIDLAIPHGKDIHSLNTRSVAARPFTPFIEAA